MIAPKGPKISPNREIGTIALNTHNVHSRPSAMNARDMVEANRKSKYNPKLK